MTRTPTRSCQIDYMIATHHVEPQTIVSIRDRRKQDALPGFLKTAIPELLERLRLLGVSPSGPPFVTYHAFGAEGVDAEVSVPIGEPVAATGRIESRVMPAMTVARTVHMGPYEKLGDAYAALPSWIRRHELEAAGSTQERYLIGPGDGVVSTDYRTEIEMPVVPLVVAAPVMAPETTNDPEGPFPSVVDAISDVPSVDAISGRSIG